MKTALLLALLALLASSSSCRTWGTLDEYSWKVVAPEKVERGFGKSFLRFSVETHDRDGKPVEGISYWWRVEWVGVWGEAHKGTSFTDQSIRIKGVSGKAAIRIYAYDQAGYEKECARQEFVVE